MHGNLPKRKKVESVVLAFKRMGQVLQAHTRPDQALLALFGWHALDLRRHSIEHLGVRGDFLVMALAAIPLKPRVTCLNAGATLRRLHARNKPRYLMGVSNPSTLIRGNLRGIGI